MTKFSIRKLFISLILGVFVLSGLAVSRDSLPANRPVSALVGVSGAKAAERRKVKNLFQLLFERKKKRQAKRQQKKSTSSRKTTSRASTKRQRSNRNKTRSRTTRKTQAATAAAAATGAATAPRAITAPPAPKKEVVAEKSETAARILVVGDFVGDRLAKGLKKQYEGDPNIVIVDKAQGNSGMVRNDIVDWPQQVTALIEEEKPKLVVVAVGMNDRQQMRTETGRANKLTDEWRAEYENRVNALVSNVAKQKIPLIWIGLPPVRSRSMNADYLLLNEIIRTRVEAGSGKFVDIWDGFTDAEGNYKAAGPDVNGQIVRLRLNDGINFTVAGRNKLAYYTERAMRPFIGAGSSLSVSLPTAGPLPSATSLPHETVNTGKTTLMSMESASIDGGDQLDGAGDFVNRQKNVGNSSTSYDLVVKGISTRPHPGRVDAGWGEAATATPQTSAKSQ